MSSSPSSSSPPSSTHPTTLTLEELVDSSTDQDSLLKELIKTGTIVTKATEEEVSKFGKPVISTTRPSKRKAKPLEEIYSLGITANQPKEQPLEKKEEIKPETASEDFASW